MAALGEVLAGQQQELRRSLAELAGTERITARVEAGQLRRRAAIVGKLRRMFCQQAAARDRYLWPSVRRLLPDGDQVASRAAEGRTEIEELFVVMGWHDDRSPSQNDLRDRLLERMAEYVDAETRLLAPLRGMMPADESERLGNAVRRASRYGPVRPHPGVPRRSWVMAVLAAPLGWWDRLVEAVEAGPYAD